MRILHVVQAMSRKFGGVQAVLHGLARNQIEAGLNVEVATTNIDAPRGLLDVPTDRAVSVNSVPIHYFPIQFRPILFSWQLQDYFKNQLCSFDLVHIHGLYRFPMTYAAWLARKTGMPYIISPHGSLDPFLYKQSRFGKWALPLKRLYERLFDIPNLNHASAIHYTAKEEMERTAFLKLRAPAVIIPNGIEWQQYDLLPQPGGFRGRIGLEAQIPLVLFVGRLHPVKGLDLLIPAFAAIRQRFPEAKLALVGPENDDYGKRVRTWVRERRLGDAVEFVGHLEGTTLTQAYVDADVFVLPSYTENFGMTIVEAMACGCPVVISDQVKIWREVQDAMGRARGEARSSRDCGCSLPCAFRQEIEPVTWGCGGGRLRGTATPGHASWNSSQRFIKKLSKGRLLRGGWETEK